MDEETTTSHTSKKNNEQFHQRYHFSLKTHDLGWKKQVNKHIISKEVILDGEIEIICSKEVVPIPSNRSST